MTIRLPKDAGERTLLVLLLLATFLLVLEPGRVPLFEPDEGRYGEIPREMLATDDWVTPRLNGVLYFEKPPLYYWSVAASMAVLGPTELAVRLPGKLSAAGMVLLAAAFARRRYGARTGLLAGLVCASSLLVVALARIAIIDPMLSLAMSGAAFAFAAFAEGDAGGDAKRARRALYGFHVACAAAVLLKGLIGVVLPGGAIVFWTLWTGRWRTLARVFSPGPLLVFLALAVPWHVAMARRHPDFLQFYFVHEHFDRFAKTEHKRTGPLVYFVPVLLAGFLPWTAFLGRWKETWPGLSRAAWKARATEGFLWMFSGLVFVFFSVSRSKLIPYVLPIWPALAVLLALGIERARARGASFRGERIATGALFGALLCVGAAYGFGAGYLGRFGAAAAGACALLALFGGFVLNVSPRLTAGADAACLVAAPWLAFIAFLLAVLPGAAHWVTPWPVVAPALAALDGDAVLVQRGHYLEVLPFYAARTTPVAALGWSELDFGRSHAGTEALFPSEEAFAALWNGPRKVVVMVHRDHLAAFAKPPLADTPATILGRENNAKHMALANRITESQSK
ncbi:MAG TPA: phospholipid carrier-dependent glycosyltransferase [Thermoanaerobaculia bacterium]|nr:phospholipid carrier-dependent glycosyltransferase [Thermoanaerobaculia bacterium]